MENLRINNVNVLDSKNITISFTHDLIENLNETNVTIVSDTFDVPNATPLTVSVSGNEFSIYCTPLSELAIYSIIFNSTKSKPFISLHNEAHLIEDNIANKYVIQGPLTEDNPVKQFLTSYYSDNLYDIDNDNGLISKYINGLSDVMSQALYDIGQVKNENYISHTLVDESHLRGQGPTDRLKEEGAYQLLRVGLTKTETNANKSISYNSFPSFPISLQGINIQEVLTISTENDKQSFNKNDFILNLTKNPVIILSSVRFVMNNSAQIYEYSIENMGYQILDSKYDQDYAFTYNGVTDNQVKLSNKLLEDSNFVIDDLVNVHVTYQYKNLGIVPNADTVTVKSVNYQTREVLPPIVNTFNLNHSVITDQFGESLTSGGLTFFNQNTNDISSPHPAFLYEVEFKLSSPPHISGQYSVDYSTGTVYVYGADANNDGTGATPPLVSYNYEYSYSFNQDYVYDENFTDVVSLPTGVLRGETSTINFDYEEALIPNIDYKASLHSESLDERVGNNLTSLNALRVKNSPVTNVFRIYNETSGEVYTVDRWNKDKVYFTYNIPPKILEHIADRSSFQSITNELLFINSSSINSNSIIIFKILLNNNQIISSSEDGIGHFLNTSLFFSDKDVFVNEKWLDSNLDVTNSIDRIDNIGEYVVDYINGTVYVGVSSTQDHNIGVVNYKKNAIVTTNDHIISVNNIYYQLSPLSNIDTTFNYISFDDTSITVDNLNNLDEQLLSNNRSANYFVYNNNIGVFDGSQFHAGVTHRIKDLRFICEFADMSNSTSPLNFSNYATFSGNIITINPISKSEYKEVQYNLIDGYYVLLDENVPYISSNITYNFSILRESTNTDLWDVSGTVEPGTQLKLILSGANSPIDGETVLVAYSFAINNSSNIVVDYNRGELYVDYSYLNDEIVISYEYGDNVIDFRESITITEGQEYFVTYRVGALRDALIANFGTLIDIPELNNFDINFERERYRDGVFAGLSAFIQGPTVNAIKTIGSVISHIEPIISESVFDGWDLGTGLLSSSKINTTGDLEYVSGRFNYGVMIDKSDQTISFPHYSNIRLEEGTFESWIIPNWKGLDNSAELTFEIVKDGQVVPESDVFIGMSGNHPTISGGKFSISKESDLGTPNLNKDGLYIYCVEDDSGSFYKWCVELVDGYSSVTSPYSIKISTDGEIYNFKTEGSYTDVNTFSGKSKLTINILPTDTLVNRKFSFIADKEKYLLDFGSGSADKNRVSLYKDVNGYFTFRAFDRSGKQHYISYDVSNWNKHEKHHVAASWKINSKTNADEMHLFIDGFEIPNLYKYGQKHTPYLHENFKTISSEEILGLSDRDIVASVDMITTAGSNVVSSSLNFNSYNIFAGDILHINEVWFDDEGYTITSVSGQDLVLDSNMPVTLSDVNYTINRTSYIVDSFINSAANIAVYRIPLFISGTDLSGSSNTVSSASTNFETSEVIPGYSININGYGNYPILNVSGNQLIIDGEIDQSFSNIDFNLYGYDEEEIPGTRADRPSYYIDKDGYQNDQITFENNIYADDLILVRTLGLNSEIVKTRHYLWSDWSEHIISTKLPPPISLDDVSIKKVILPKTKIDSTNSALVSGEFNSNEFVPEQPTNSQDGRSLAISVSGTNIDFTTPLEVIINGVSEIYTVSETILFDGTDGYDKYSNNLYKSINWIKVNVRPTNSNKPGAVIEVKERYDITYSENSGLVPEIKFSYQIGSGTKLYSSDGYTVTDDTKTFSEKQVGNYLLIHSPAYDVDGYLIDVPGFYIISGISNDRHTLNIDSTTAGATLPIDLFSDGYYSILNVSDFRSGLQNGMFTFEALGMPSVSYPLPMGSYDFKYKSYGKIKMTPNVGNAFIGSDLFGSNQLNGIIDQVKIYSTMLTDTRIGETIPLNQRSVTKDFNSLKELTADENTLMLLNFDNSVENTAEQHIYDDRLKGIFHSEEVVNSTFGHSICLQDKPIVLSNDGILDVTKQGTIEFWTNPQNDTGNDPNDRYYFDAFGAVLEEVVSDNNSTIRVSGSIEDVISIKLTHNNQSVNYYDGGVVEIDSNRTVRETVTSTGSAIVVVGKDILQVTSVKVENNYTNTDYFNFGTIGSDNRTIYLGTSLPQGNISVVVTYQPAENQNDKLNKQVIRLNRKLPQHNTPVTVTYLPRKMRGDRISIFKDEFGYVNFRIIADYSEHIVRAPTRWVSGTWHRIKASYIVNTSAGADEMRLWVDGYEYSNILFNNNSTLGKFPENFGSSSVGDGYYVSRSISFTDPINTLFIGTAYDRSKPIYSLIDNLRISNIARPIYNIYNESIDVNWSSNTSAVLPVTEDLYTTYLLDLSSNRSKNDYFSLLKNRETGLFNFLVKIIDSYGIIDSSEKSKEVLEKLISILKPANTRAFIEYIS